MRVRQSAILKKLVGNDKGFTLIELLIVVALTGIISAAAAMSIHQVLAGTSLSNNQNTSVNQVRNAVHWISRDVQMAQNVTDAPTPPKFLELTWEGWSGTPYTVYYTLEDGKLQRNYNGQQMLIAQYIRPQGAGTSCSWNAEERVLSVSITAEVDGRTETRMFQVRSRPD